MTAAQALEFFQDGLVDLHAEMARPVTIQEIANYFGWEPQAVRTFLGKSDLAALGIELSCIEGPGAHNPVVGLIVGSRPLPRYSPTPDLVRRIQAARPDTQAVNASLRATAAACELEAAVLTSRAAQLLATAACIHRWVQSETATGYFCVKCGHTVAAPTAVDS